MYVVWVRIDETLPWIELKGEHQTRNKAKKMAEKILNNAKMKIVAVSERRIQMKTLATAKTRR